MISELVTTTLPDETQGQCRALHDNTNAIAISINNILEIGEKYTLSLYLKAYSNNGQCGINQNSELLPYSNEWTRVVIPFTAISTGLSIIFTTGVYVYKAKLEKGSVATVWNYSEADKELFMQTQGIGQWCYQNDITKINGGKIATGTITADKIDVNNLFAQNITVTGTLTGATLSGAVITGSSGQFTHDFNVNIKEAEGSYNFLTEMYINHGAMRLANYFADGYEPTYSLNELYSMLLLSQGTVRLTANNLTLTAGQYTDDTGGNIIIQSLGRTILEMFQNNAIFHGIVSAENIYDTGWVSVNFSEYFDNYDSTSNPQYRCINGQVYLRGVAKPKGVYGSNKITLFTIPVDYAPRRTVHCLCQGSMHYKWLLTVETDGTVTFSRYSDGSGWVNTSTNSWLPFDVNYARY